MDVNKELTPIRTRRGLLAAAGALLGLGAASAASADEHERVLGAVEAPTAEVDAAPAEQVAAPVPVNEFAKIHNVGEIARNPVTGSEFSGGRHEDAKFATKVQNGRGQDWIKLVDKFLPGKKAGARVVPTFDGFRYQDVEFFGFPVVLPDGKQIIMKYGKQAEGNNFNVLFSEAEEIPELAENRVMIQDLSSEEIEVLEENMAVTAGNVISIEGGRALSESPREVSDLRRNGSQKAALAIEKAPSISA